MNKNHSSEEKLLNLIRRKKAGIPQGARRADKSGTFFEWNRLTSLFWQWGAGILIAGAACMLAWLLAKYHFWDKRGVNLLEGISQPAVHGDEEGAQEDSVHVPSYDYKDIIQARDIFSSPVEQKKDAGQVATTPKSAISDRYKLLGIMLDNNPTAIIEDVQTHQTVILSAGQKINDVVIEEIRADRVILKEDDQILELVR